MKRNSLVAVQPFFYMTRTCWRPERLRTDSAVKSFDNATPSLTVYTGRAKCLRSWWRRRAQSAQAHYIFRQIARTTISISETDATYLGKHPSTCLVDLDCPLFVLNQVCSFFIAVCCSRRPKKKNKHSQMQWKNFRAAKPLDPTALCMQLPITSSRDLQPKHKYTPWCHTSCPIVLIKCESHCCTMSDFTTLLDLVGMEPEAAKSPSGTPVGISILFWTGNK